MPGKASSAATKFHAADALHGRRMTRACVTSFSAQRCGDWSGRRGGACLDRLETSQEQRFAGYEVRLKMVDHQLSHE
jgi:hypothetical protein